MTFRRTLLGPALLAALAGLGCSSDDESTAPGGTTSGPPAVTGDVEEIMATLPKSCAFTCGECAEPGEAFACPAMAPWDELPHAEACEAWDGTYPEPVAGQCTASAPTGEAARKAGPLEGGGVVLPDGHRIRAAGREVLFEEAELEGGFPMSILAIPGTRFVLVSDGGIDDNALRVLDLDALASPADPPVVSLVAFPRPESLFYGMVWIAPGRVLASGGGDGAVYAFDVDAATGAASRASERDILLVEAADDRWYAGPIAATADGSRLAIGPNDAANEIRIVSLGDADYGATLASISIDSSSSLFDLRLDPFDPEGTTMYATDQSGSRLIEIDAVAGEATRTIDLGKNPAQMAFLDATYMVVAESDSDALAIVDRAAGEVVARTPVFEEGALHGFSPSALSYDATSGRLYAALGGVNAVEAYDVELGTPPTLTPVGRIPAGWWPTAVHADTDGSLVVLNGKGHGTGTDGEQYPWTQGPITRRMRGSVQHVPAADLGDLGALSAVVEENRALGEISGRSEVTCPGGADDFPVPSDNESGPSKLIKKVVFVVRENKTYDAVFGDRADLGDGDPSLVMASDPELQEAIWQNARAIATAFSNFDNFYTDAEQSLQGHNWVVHGRTTDFFERAWLTMWGRATRSVSMPISVQAQPEEGGVFTWLDANGVDYANLGEIVDQGPNGVDMKYPGLYYAANVPDTDKSCYMAGRIRLRCDLPSFTFAVQPNDHTYGGEAGTAAPEVMIAVNDEATGLLLDALSHSPDWKHTLLIVTEDDPQDGGDHVDLHRTLLLMASPWVKRGYVSSGHYDVASIHKLFAHVFGIPYNNEAVRSALLPLDAFTSTPDFTPYDYLPRKVDAPCNGAGTPEAKEAEAWDFTDPDDQPGLSAQVSRMLREPRAKRGVRVVAPRTTGFAR